MNIDGERSEVAELFCTAESPVEDDWCLVETGGHGVDHMIQVGRTAAQVARGMVTGSACALAGATATCAKIASCAMAEKAQEVIQKTRRDIQHCDPGMSRAHWQMVRAWLPKVAAIEREIEAKKMERVNRGLSEEELDIFTDQRPVVEWVDNEARLIIIEDGLTGDEE